MRVGLTGGVASGKSTVSAMLAELGAVIIDADALAREVVEQGTPGLDAVVEAFGPSCSRPRATSTARPWARWSSATRRSAAAARGDRAPAGLRADRRARGGGRRPTTLVVHDIPLLAESGRADTFDAVIVVDVPDEIQIARMVRDRGWTREDAESRIAAQATRERPAGHRHPRHRQQRQPRRAARPGQRDLRGAHSSRVMNTLSGSGR